MAAVKCTRCEVPVKEYITGKKKIEGKIFCKSCYYRALGDAMEESPIGVLHANCKIKGH